MFLSTFFTDRATSLSNGSLSLMEPDLRLQLVELDREVDFVHLIGDHLAELEVPGLRSDDREFVPRDIEGLEKGEAVDVIPVRMADGEERLDRFTRRHQLIAEPPDAGPRVKHNEVVLVQPYFDARGVPAVPDGVFPRRGEGTTRPPEFDFHAPAPSPTWVIELAAYAT
jgi:hypothetical protein